MAGKHNLEYQIKEEYSLFGGSGRVFHGLWIMGDFILDGRGTAGFASVFPHLPGLLASVPQGREREQLPTGHKWPTTGHAGDGIF